MPKRSKFSYFGVGGYAIVKRSSSQKRQSQGAAIKTAKGAAFRRASDNKVAAVQRSFEKARRGKDLFGLRHAD
jgi:hypothetical protein